MTRTAQGTVGFVSLGCAKNLIDSETMLGRIASEGFVLTGDTTHADVVVVNTCGFLEDSRLESLDTIRQLVSLKVDGQIKRVVVAGCMVGEYKERLIDEVPQVDALVSVNDRELLAGVLTELRGSGELARNMKISDPDALGTVYDDRGRFRLTPRHYAYLRVSEGCDHTCSFCIIPQIRGRHRSKSMDHIIEEAQELAADGCKELIIVAQDSTYYGIDLNGEKQLAKLLARLDAEVDGIEWIRVMYAYPNQVTQELVDVMASADKILPYIDMPLQHINSRMLATMRRGGNRELIERWITRFREAMPNFRFRSTFIAGFPGETDAELQELVDWIKEGHVDRLGCFAYSPEEDSHSAQLDGHLPDEVREERQGRVMEAAQAVLFAKNEALVGTQARVLIDSASQDPKYPNVGRTFADCPEIDCEVYVSTDDGEELPSGSFVDVQITASLGYDLQAKVIAER